MSTHILICDATTDLSGLSLDNFILCGHPERSHTIRNLELCAGVGVQLRQAAIIDKLLWVEEPLQLLVN